MDVEPTELDDLDVEKVAGVESPANGSAFAVLKSAREAPGKVTIHNHYYDADGHEISKSESAEADEGQEVITGEPAGDTAVDGNRGDVEPDITRAVDASNIGAVAGRIGSGYINKGELKDLRKQLKATTSPQVQEQLRARIAVAETHTRS